MTIVYSTSFDPASPKTAKVGAQAGWAINPTPPYDPPMPGGTPMFMPNDQMNMTVAGYGSCEATLSFVPSDPHNHKHTPFAEYNHGHKKPEYPYVLGDYLTFDTPHPNPSQWKFSLTVEDPVTKLLTTVTFDPELQVGPGG
jgi:hypothetical protein